MYFDFYCRRSWNHYNQKDYIANHAEEGWFLTIPLDQDQSEKTTIVVKFVGCLLYCYHE